MKLTNDCYSEQKEQLKNVELLEVSSLNIGDTYLVNGKLKILKLRSVSISNGFVNMSCLWQNVESED